MWTWLLNPKNLLLVALAALFIAAGGLFLWERGEVNAKDTTIAKQAGDILDLQKTNAGLQGQIADYQANLAAIKKAQVEQQAVANNTAALLAKANKITANCVIGGDDEKTIDSITNDFNNSGVLLPVQTTGGSPEAGAAGVSKANTPNTGNTQRYTVKQIVQNYLTLIDYTLQLEKTVSCYEAP
jgi:hypothetical protein